MLVLIAFLFVLLAVVLRVAGALMDDGLALTYASIGASAIAGVLILIAVRRAKGASPPDPPLSPKG